MYKLYELYNIYLHTFHMLRDIDCDLNYLSRNESKDVYMQVEIDIYMCLIYHIKIILDNIILPLVSGLSWLNTIDCEEKTNGSALW